MNTLYRIQSLSDPLISILRDDPVRPEIPAELRVSDRSEIFVLKEPQWDRVTAAVCVIYRDSVPGTVEELFWPNVTAADTAVFYTIWSYVPGAGRELIQQAVAAIRKDLSAISRFVTLSPPTDMARKFHLRNGAGVFRVNADTVNYVYQQDNNG